MLRYALKFFMYIICKKLYRSNHKFIHRSAFHLYTSVLTYDLQKFDVATKIGAGRSSKDIGWVRRWAMLLSSLRVTTIN